MQCEQKKEVGKRERKKRKPEASHSLQLPFITILHTVHTLSSNMAPSENHLTLKNSGLAGL